MEYSLGLPQGRVRTQSQTFQGTFDFGPTSSTTVSTPIPVTPISAPPVLSALSPLPIPPPIPIMADKKRGQLKGLKKSKKRIGGTTNTKDLGRFKATDDLALILGIQQTNDLKTVHRGVKFSCKFTYQELSNRWYSLMYDEAISRIAVSAIRNLHPEMVASVQKKALYSKAEEDILASIKSTETPTEEAFQDLLTKNATIFFHARTPKSLLTHWELMRQYMLLNDQAIPPMTTPDGMQSFSDYEDTVNDAEILSEVRDETLELELTMADRRNKKEIRSLENELQRWSVLLDSVTGYSISPEFDNQTLAILRGRAVRYLMRSREITFGRNSKEFTVDVNLALEGPAYKVSRKQGTVKMRSNGDFFLANEGKRPVFVDGIPVTCGNKTKLHNNNVIEVNAAFCDHVKFKLINFNTFVDFWIALHLSCKLRFNSSNTVGIIKAVNATKLKC